MDLIIGGGTYGTRALLQTQKADRLSIVIDTDPFSSVQKNHRLPVVTVEQISDPETLQPGAYFIQGSIAEAARIVITHQPERIFPTVPVHVSAGILTEWAGFTPDPAGADAIAACIPEEIIVGRNGADIYCSLNPDMRCNPNCPEPMVCPVTGERRDRPLWVMLEDDLSKALSRDAGPKGRDTHWTEGPGRDTRSVIIQSRQCGPGLGYIQGTDLISVMEHVQNEHAIWIGTACKCHGVVTALKKPGQ